MKKKLEDSYYLSLTYDKATVIKMLKYSQRDKHINQWNRRKPRNRPI